jgi:hypothetical protein
MPDSSETGETGRKSATSGTVSRRKIEVFGTSISDLQPSDLACHAHLACLAHNSRDSRPRACRASRVMQALSSHLKTLPKPESLRHLQILPETPAPRAADFFLASPLAGLVIVAPEPTVCAGLLTVGPAEADEGRGAFGLKGHPRHGVLARGCGARGATSRGVRGARVASAHSYSRCWSIRWESTTGSVVARRRARADTFWESASGQACTRAKGVRGMS